MSNRLPPLSAIQGFEAAARHLSFKAAAEELNLTQSAVSHQVQRLENVLEARLFVRRSNRIELTEAGRAYLGEVREVLEKLRASTAKTQGADDGDILAVQGTPAFIARWLTPRLESFRRLHPGLRIKLSTGLPPTDFAGGEIDVVAHWGQNPVEGVRVDPFLVSARSPVCSPELLDRYGPLKHPRDLKRFTLLHDMVQDGWRGWFERAGVNGMGHDRGPSFAHCELALGAAERGQGVALAYTALIARELEEGRLVSLFPIETDPVVIYSIACQEGRSDVPKIAAFRVWAIDQAQASAPPTGNEVQLAKAAT